MYDTFILFLCHLFIYSIAAVTTILLVAASYAACNRTLVIILITLAMGFFGNYIPGMRVNALDLSPNYSGSVLSLVNGAGCISGLIFPTFIGMMIPDVRNHFSY